MPITETLRNKFENDYIKYKSRIGSIEDLRSKSELVELLETIADKISFIERSHENALYGDKRALLNISENRNEVLQLRKQLEQRLAALKV